MSQCVFYYGRAYTKYIHKIDEKKTKIARQNMCSVSSMKYKWANRISELNGSGNDDNDDDRRFTQKGETERKRKEQRKINEFRRRMLCTFCGWCRLPPLSPQSQPQVCFYVSVRFSKFSFSRLQLNLHNIVFWTPRNSTKLTAIRSKPKNQSIPNVAIQSSIILFFYTKCLHGIVVSISFEIVSRFIVIRSASCDTHTHTHTF